ncbi:MAG: hypothetical protein IKD62_01245 [Oscillospiraceae bacterium]|nr:hypothetical protein [Oscillospiraceae bacterium]
MEDWRFKCPRCGNVATGHEFKDAGTEPDAMAQECIGRYVNGKGCDWAAFGLFDICTAHIHYKGDKWIPVFEFAGGKEEGDHEPGA